MERYAGSGLSDGPSVAVIANDAIGNFIVATCVLQAIRRELGPGRLDYFGGLRTWEFQVESDLADHTFPLHGATASEVALLLADLDEAYDLVVNLESSPLSKAFSSLVAGRRSKVCGPCAGPGGRGELPFLEDDRGSLWADRDWTAPDLTLRFPFLESGFIGEIFCRLAYLDGLVPPYSIPVEPSPIPSPDVVVATAASLPEKLWPVEKWIELLGKLRAAGVSVGLVGAAPASQKEHWKGASDEDQILGQGLALDLRGKLTLPQVAGIVKGARLVLSLDNGILHIAAAVGTPSIGLFRHGIHRLWAPPVDTVRVLTAGEGKLVEDIPAASVWSTLQRTLEIG